MSALFQQSAAIAVNSRDDEEATDGLLATRFTLGDASFGVDARLVQEVVKVGELTPVHSAPSGVIGVRNLRGRIVTVVDMATHLNLGHVESGPETRLLIMEHQGEFYGFLVDAVTDAIAMDEKRIGKPPARCHAGHPHAKRCTTCPVRSRLRSPR
jgi:chemotaxis signal transduction protein